MKNYPLSAAIVLVLLGAMLLTGDTGNWHMNNLWVATEIYLGSSWFTPTGLYVNGPISNGPYAITTSGNFTAGSVVMTGSGLTLPSTGTVGFGSGYTSLTGTSLTLPSSGSMQIGTGALINSSSITLPGGTIAGNLTVSGSSASLPATTVSSLKIGSTTISPGGGGTASCNTGTHVASITYSVSASGVISLSTTCN